MVCAEASHRTPPRGLAPIFLQPLDDLACKRCTVQSHMPIVMLSPYCAAWPQHFDTIKATLLSAFAPSAVVVEHIGSTAVPGLVAKPVIDVLLGATTLAAIEAKIQPLGELGFDYVAKYESELPLRRYFVKAASSAPRVHVHGVEWGSRSWLEQLAFRDALRADAQLCLAYQSLKLQLAAKFANYKSAYTAAKGPFIAAAVTAILSRESLVGCPQRGGFCVS